MALMMRFTFNSLTGMHQDALAYNICGQMRPGRSQLLSLGGHSHLFLALSPSDHPRRSLELRQGICAQIRSEGNSLSTFIATIPFPQFPPEV